MRIHLTNTGAITLLDAQNFTRLDVLIDSQPSDRVEQAIAQLGYREDEQHIRIAPDVLRFLSGHAGKPEWEKSFQDMLVYASSSGWIDDKGKIRVHIRHNEHDIVITDQAFKEAMRVLPAGISAITTGSGTNVNGLIVSSLTSISASPPLIGFFVGKSSSITSALLSNRHFVANILGQSHQDIVNQFLNQPQGVARFTQGDWRTGLHDMPVLNDALASVECDIICTTSLGTHHLIVGKVRQSESRTANPIINFNCGIHELALQAS